MFWRFGGYANISTIDTILDKPDFTLDELLDESDLIQELKQHNTKLIEYLREDHVLEKLLEYVVATKLEAVETPEDPADDDFKGKGRLLPFSRPRASSRAADSAEASEEEQEKKRNRHALVACEILSSDTWSIYEALIENRQLIRDFWTFLSRPAPLDPLQASYFTKVNESLFEKKTEEMMELLWSLPNVVSDLLKHVECPMIMDLLLKIIAMDRNEGGQGVVEWLYTKDIIPTLLSFLSPEHSWVLQTAAGDFLKAIITISANASQNEQQCIGPNELTRQLVSRPCVEQLIGYMLGGGNPLTVGVGIVIEVIRKNNSDYDPDVGTEANSIPSSRDPIYLGTLLRLFSQNVPKFMSLIMKSPVQKRGLESTFGEKLEPLGFDRFKTCELMAELLHCSNMGLLNEVGSEQLIATRDAERHRLRSEGRLGPREDDGSADDLTMRMTHLSHDESRRLEVTNADDDGFEEVEHNNDIDDTTEFIKAEDDVGTPSRHSLLLEKDEDVFVDKPPSSPGLTTGMDKLDVSHFEEPDLVVAPLSPAKPKTDEPSSSSLKSDDTAPTKETIGEEATKQLPGPTEVEAKDISEQTASSNSSKSNVAIPDPPTTGNSATEDEKIGRVPVSIDTSQPEIKISVDELKSGETGPVEAPSSSTKADESPAPLSSVPSDLDKETGQIPEDPVESMPTEESTQEEQAQQPTENPSSESSDEPQIGVAEPVESVVGDFLKMQFVDHRVVPTILSFFFAYPWNNFLHNVVYDIVQQVFNGPMDRGYNPTLAVSLFEAADVTTAIIHGQAASDESQAKSRTRMGYMGHLTLIAEEVVKFTERHPPELLSEMVLDKVMSQDWINYVEGALADTRERDNAILGGVRPEVALGHRANLGGGGLAGIGLSSLGASSSGGSNALAEAGLNGGNGIGPFTISSGTLMSGFGSSSDEEDEEGEGDEEDINSEFRAYTSSLNNSGGGGDLATAPSIPPPPPPPPPLNIAPSRARLQLAARLAMHQKNNQIAQEAASSATTTAATTTTTTTTTTAGTTMQDNHDEEDNDLADPFGDGEEEDLDDLDEDGADHFGRGSWWRGLVNRPAEEADSEDEDDEEFGDFAMAETEKPGDEGGNETVLLKPLAVHPASAGGGSRGLSGLWPFGTRSEKDKEDEKEKEEQKSTAVVPILEREAEASDEKEAARRTTMVDDEDEDDEEDANRSKA